MKETLTKDNIAEDIKKYCIEIIFRLIAVIIFVVIAVSLMIFWFKDLPTFYFLSLSPVIVLALSAIVSLMKHSFLLHKVCKNRLYVVTSSLTASYKKQGWSSSGLSGSFLFRKPYRLRFSNYGEYSIPAGKNYRWSEKHCMDDASVYNYAIPGDEFYLAVVDNNIVYAYSRKLFELEK